MKQIILTACVALSLFACQTKPAKQVETKPAECTKTCTKAEAPKGVEYIKSDAPDAESPMTKAYNIPSSDPNSKVQSPINILSKNIPAAKTKFAMKFDEQTIKIDNLGHTVQVDFKAGSTITYDGVVYNAKQLHFHTPSEHLLNGITYPMEAHLVCTIADTMLLKKGAKQYLVMGYFFQMGAENNFIKEFITKIPAEEHQSVDVAAGVVKLNDMIASKKELNYYHYDGSLTTPPFTESVSWHVCSTILEASPEQIQTINKMIGNNARHIQNANGRGACIE